MYLNLIRKNFKISSNFKFHLNGEFSFILIELRNKNLLNFYPINFLSSNLTDDENKYVFYFSKSLFETFLYNFCIFFASNLNIFTSRRESTNHNIRPSVPNLLISC